VDANVEGGVAIGVGVDFADNVGAEVDLDANVAAEVEIGVDVDFADNVGAEVDLDANVAAGVEIGVDVDFVGSVGAETGVDANVEAEVDVGAGAGFEDSAGAETGVDANVEAGVEIDVGSDFADSRGAEMPPDANSAAEVEFGIRVGVDLDVAPAIDANINVSAGSEAASVVTKGARTAAAVCPATFAACWTAFAAGLRATTIDGFPFCPCTAPDTAIGSPTSDSLLWINPRYTADVTARIDALNATGIRNR
jgi:hypothetical protein